MLLKFLAPLLEQYGFNQNRNFQNRNQNTQNEILYHKDIGFPNDIQMPRGFNPVMDLRYGSHAKDAARDDRYGQMRLPQRIDVRKGETVEIGVTGKTVTKMVIRFSYNDTLDMVMVIIPASGFVKTVWFNQKNDTHKTLNHAKYANPNKQLRH